MRDAYIAWGTTPVRDLNLSPRLTRKGREVLGISNQDYSRLHKTPAFNL